MDKANYECAVLVCIQVAEKDGLIWLFLFRFSSSLHAAFMH